MGCSDAVETSIKEIEGVCGVHDLHIWSLTVGKASLSVHIFVDDAHQREGKSVLAAATSMLASRYNIHHTTIQVEFNYCLRCFILMSTYDFAD